MATNKEYNGWYNYETWLVKLWMDNEEGSYNYWNERAQEIYDDAEADNTFTRDERATIDLADALKSEFKEAQPEVTGLWADMMNAAMSEVNWHEIAEHMINDVDKEEEEEEEEAGLLSERQTYAWLAWLLGKYRHDGSAVIPREKRKRNGDQDVSDL